MSRRHKLKQKKQKQTTPNAEALAAAALQKGNFKDALKQARVAARKTPSTDNQLLLEFAMLQRARQLHQTSHAEQCLDLLESLAKSATHPEVIEALPELLLRAGVLDRYPQYRDRVSQSDRNSVRAGELDREICSATPKNRGQDAELVRSALQAVERGDDDQANQILRGIGRQSLAADWRLFVRGLMAWYRRDLETAEQNWTRLNPDRAATKIVERLRELDQFQISSPNARVADTRNRLSSNHRLPALIEQLQQLAPSDGRAIRTTLGLCKRASPERPDLLERIVVALCGKLLSSDTPHALETFHELAKGTIAPRLDPNWNRALALSLDEEDFEEGYERSRLWQNYLIDLNSIDVLSDQDRKVAKSLVARQIGVEAMRNAERWTDCRCGASHDEEVAEEIDAANEHLESSIEYYPRNQEAWKALMALKIGFENDEAGFIDVGRRLLVHFPDDIEALRLLSQKLLFSHPFEAREFAEQAARLRPLDREVRNMLVATRFGCARQYATDRDFEKARAELDLVDESLQDANTKTALLVRRAIIEFAAGKSTRAEQLADEAKQVLEEPTLALLQLAVEGIRIRMSSARVKEFERQFTVQLKRKCNSQTAAALSDQMVALRAIEYLRQDNHEKLVLAYIRRTSRVKYEPQDLRSVCQFLTAIGEDKLLEKQVEKGRKKFPDDPWFHLAAGRAELDKGPGGCKTKRVANCLNRVIEICSGRDDDESREMLSEARGALSFLESHGEQIGRPPRGLGDLLEGKMSPLIRELLLDILKDKDTDTADLPPELVEEFEQLPPIVRKGLIRALENAES